MPPLELVIPAVAWIAFWLGRRAGHLNVGAEIARASCEVACEAFEAGRRAEQRAQAAATPPVHIVVDGELVDPAAVADAISRRAQRQ